MSSGIQLLPAELGGIVIESLIYGVFLVLCSTCFYVLFTKRRSSGVASEGPVNKTMLLICTVLFLSITAVSTCNNMYVVADRSLTLLHLKHWICDVTRLFNAILYYPQGPVAYYANLAIPVNVVKTGLYIFECMVGDSLMVRFICEKHLEPLSHSLPRFTASGSFGIGKQLFVCYLSHLSSVSQVGLIFPSSFLSNSPQ